MMMIAVTKFTFKEFKHMILDGVYDDDCGYKIYIL